MPVVSIIIPTYNLCTLLKKTIESVLKQSYMDFEVLVIDDGSTDDTRSIVSRITDRRVKYFYKTNGGHCSARNFGLIKAKSEYVAFLDHDDLWTDGYLETMMNHLQEKKEYGAAYARVLLIDDNGQTKPFATEDRYISGSITRAFFKGGPCIMPSATLFRKDILNGFYFDEALKLGEDNDAFMRLSLKTPFLFVSDAKVLRRETPGSLSQHISADNQCYGILAFERFYYRLGGDRYASAIVARRTISHKYRRAAKTIYKNKGRAASIILLKRAICYYPFDIRLYFDLLKSLLLSRKNDPNPNWKMPGALPIEITVSNKGDAD